VISGPPKWDVAVPGPVRALAGSGPVLPVWMNEMGGVTFQLGAGRVRRFVKWVPGDSDADLAGEAARMRWAAAYTPVPQVLGEGSDAAGSWLLTSALPGESAVASRWRARPETAVAAIGAGLRGMHDALPVDRCPFSWSAADRVAATRRSASRGELDAATWNPDHQHLTAAEALERLDRTPPVDTLVVCHGDSCAPNTLITDDGRWSGHVDLGALGVADRWADLAVATWSATWNYGPQWQGPLLEAYGVRPDPARTRYYRLLYDLSP
jgi:kanamycin kinase